VTRIIINDDLSNFGLDFDNVKFLPRRGETITYLSGKLYVRAVVVNIVHDLVDDIIYIHVERNFCN